MESGTATVTYGDPDGNAIPSTSTSTFVTPVVLSVVDPSGTVSISPTTITNAAQVVTVSYTGGATLGASVTLNATAGGSAIGTLVSKTSGFQTTFALGANKRPDEIDAGADGALWFSESSNVAIGRMDPANPTGSPSSPYRIRAAVRNRSHLRPDRPATRTCGTPSRCISADNSETSVTSRYQAA